MEDNVRKAYVKEMLERDIAEKENIHAMILKAGRRSRTLTYTLLLSIVVSIICACLMYQATLTNRQVSHGIMQRVDSLIENVENKNDNTKSNK